MVEVCTTGQLSGHAPPPHGQRLLSLRSGRVLTQTLFYRMKSLEADANRAQAVIARARQAQQAKLQSGLFFPEKNHQEINVKGQNIYRKLDCFPLYVTIFWFRLLLASILVWNVEIKITRIMGFFAFCRTTVQTKWQRRR